MVSKPTFESVLESVKNQFRDSGVDPDMVGWQGLIQLKAEELFNSSADSAPKPIPSASVKIGSKLPFKSLYHLTHYRNLDGILQRGILSWTEAHSLCLAPTDISDSEVQKLRCRPDPCHNRPIHDYAPLYINPRNPMLFSRKDIQNAIVVLRVSTSVLEANEHVFTDGNAASGDTRFSTNASVVIQSFDALNSKFWMDAEDGKRRRCAEVLVHPRVSPEYILEAFCRHEALAERLRAKTDLPITVKSTLFFD